jgi:hypothetical protein
MNELKAVKTIDDMKEVKFIRTWMSEGLPSVTVSINGTHVTFENLDNDVAASFMNPNSIDAKTSILKHLTTQLMLLNVDNELDDEDEFEAELDYDSDSYGDSDPGDWGGNY